MNTEKGTTTVEGLFLSFLLLLICLMGLEIRCLFRSAEKLQTRVRNEAVALASLDGSLLRLTVLEEEQGFDASNALAHLVEATGLHEMTCRYWVFVGTGVGSVRR